MKRLLAFLSMGVIILMSTSCCCVLRDQPTGLQFKDSGTTVKASIGKSIQIVLDANATTGYCWKIVNYNKNILKLEKSDYKVDSKLIGAGGKQSYCFDVIGKGKTELKIIYHRPWEKDVKPLKIFNVTISN